MFPIPSMTRWVFLLALMTLGCQSEQKEKLGTVSLKGKIVNQGTPWSFDESKLKFPKGVSMPPGLNAGGNSPVQLVFFSDTPGVDAIHAKLNVQDGTFTVDAIVPGRYRVALYLSSSAGAASDPFGNKFTIANTKIVRDVFADQDITIDVSKADGG